MRREQQVIGDISEMENNIFCSHTAELICFDLSCCPSTIEFNFSSPSFRKHLGENDFLFRLHTMRFEYFIDYRAERGFLSFEYRSKEKVYQDTLLRLKTKRKRSVLFKSLTHKAKCSSLRLFGFSGIISLHFL